MSAWFKSDYRFDSRFGIFWVSQKHMVLERFVFECLQQADEPDRLEAAVLALLKKYRPELAGAVLFHMHYNAEYGRWEFSVSHPSLPPCKPFDRPPARPLDPAYEWEMAHA